MPAATEAELELAAFLTRVLQLEGRVPEILDPDAPLFGSHVSSWGLDSIDALEIALALEQEFGVVLRSEDEATQQAFSSLRALNRHVRSGAT